MITNADTGRAAWDTLAADYASTNTTNVMHLEEVFGIARKTSEQSMSQWIAYMKSLVSQLCGVGVIEPNKVANHILNGLDSAHDSMKYTLQARSGSPTIETPSCVGASKKLSRAPRDAKRKSDDYASSTDKRHRDSVSSTTYTTSTASH